MSIEDEIAAVKATAQKKLRNLRERERKHQQEIDLRVIALLRSRYTDIARELETEALTQLVVEAAARSARAKASRGPGPR